ncbi:hypothetical protein GCM10007916_24100 [Psychromonas marina]|uniref:Uncharacterized protein n=1 Tax=Psychromonas marina TaxID=88364 RepID=A0ABQ6E1U8_9GAMM|nr:hypothetical protein GCM10007916_24100 [Psychromonas marina]
MRNIQIYTITYKNSQLILSNVGKLKYYLKCLFVANKNPTKKAIVFPVKGRIMSKVILLTF